MEAHVYSIVNFRVFIVYTSSTELSCIYKIKAIIALSGSTRVSTGPHLHLTTKKDGKAFNLTILLEYIRSIKN